MIRINLLPYREKADLLLRKVFFVRLSLVAIMGVVFAVLANAWLSTELLKQQGVNDMLRQQVDTLDQKVGEVDQLKKQLDDLVKKRQWVADIQSVRNASVRIMVDFVKVVPSGVVLKSIKQNGSDIVVTGFSEAGDGVSFFMRAVSDQASYLNGVYLQDMQASSYEGRSGFDFSVSMKVGPSAAASAAAAVVVKQRSSAAHGVL